jgi:hypothetical protein
MKCPSRGAFHFLGITLKCAGRQGFLYTTARLQASASAVHVSNCFQLLVPNFGKRHSRRCQSLSTATRDDERQPLCATALKVCSSKDTGSESGMQHLPPMNKHSGESASLEDDLNSELHVEWLTRANTGSAD